MPHTNASHKQLNFGTPQQTQYDNTSHPPPFYTLDNWQQRTSLPQNSLGAYPRAQESTELALFDSFLRASTSSGPPPWVATASLHRESVNESEPQATSLLLE